MWKNLQLIGLSIILSLLIGGIILLVAQPPHGTPVILLPTKSVNTISIYINGEVITPGVYSLSKGSRITDAVNAAGGFTNHADPNSINLASELNDEDFIHVFALGESTSLPTASSTITTGSKGIIADIQKVDVNRATLDELMTLPGIGPVKAQAIIDYRTNSGIFTVVDDLLKVSGIGPSTLEKLADYVVINP